MEQLQFAKDQQWLQQTLSLVWMIHELLAELDLDSLYTFFGEQINQMFFFKIRFWAELNALQYSK